MIKDNTHEDFKRPGHPDFMDTSELRKIRFTGLRHNSITDTAEIWILGHVEATISAAEVKLDPLAINKAYEEVFCLPEIMPDTDAAKRFIAVRNALTTH